MTSALGRLKTVLYAEMSNWQSKAWEGGSTKAARVDLHLEEICFVASVKRVRERERK